MQKDKNKIIYKKINQNQTDKNKNQNIQANQQSKKIHSIIKTRNITNKTQKIFLNGQKLNSQLLILLLKQSKCINPNIIKKLEIEINIIDDQGVRYLSELKWNHLQYLSFFQNHITMKGVWYLAKGAQMKCFPELKELNLFRNKIGSCVDSQIFKQEIKEDEGLILKFANENTKLGQLNLQENNLNDNDMQILFKANHISKDQKYIKVFKNLYALYLIKNNIKGLGIKSLTQNMVQYPKLMYLSFSYNMINKNGIKCLFSNKSKKKFDNLRELRLYHNAFIGDQGILQLIKCQHLGVFPILQVLDIQDINLSDNGLQHLIKLYNPSKSLKNLKQLNIYQNLKLINKTTISKCLRKRFKENISSIIVDLDDMEQYD